MEEKDVKKNKSKHLITCSAVFNKFSISKLLVRLVGLVPVWIFCGSADDGAGELSTSGENTSLPCFLHAHKKRTTNTRKLDAEKENKIKWRSKNNSMGMMWHDSLLYIGRKWSLIFSHSRIQFNLMQTKINVVWAIVQTWMIFFF